MNNSKPSHPSFAELLALTVDELPPQRADEIREHLLDCAACLAQMRELLRLPESPPSPDFVISDADQAAAWSRLSATLDAEDAEEIAEKQPPLRALPGGVPSKPMAPPVAQPRAGAARRFSVGWLPLAAMLLVSAGIGYLARQPHFPQKDPAAGAEVTHLLSQEFLLRGPAGTDDSGAECPPAGGTYVWVMTFTKRPADATEAQVTLLRQGGVAIPLSPKQINDKGQVVLALPWDSIENGKYTVELAAGGDAAPIREQFPITVDCP